MSRSHNVDSLSAVLEVAALRSGVRKTPHMPLSALSMRAVPIRSLEGAERGQISAQIIHTPFHFTCAILTGDQMQGVPNVAPSALIYMNSLNRNVVAPRRELVGNIDSPMVAELCDGFTHVLTVQGVQQKAGNSCGFAALLCKALALYLRSYSAVCA